MNDVLRNERIIWLLSKSTVHGTTYSRNKKPSCC